jgi:hypothetical protein
VVVDQTYEGLVAKPPDLFFCLPHFNNLIELMGLKSRIHLQKIHLISNLKQVKRKGHTVDALASRAEEGRGKTAKSLG